MRIVRRFPARWWNVDSRRCGSILVALLWCFALLSVVVVGVLYSSRLELMVVKNHGDQIQAHYLALAGIEKTKALLYHDLKERQRMAKNHSGTLFDSTQDFKDVPFGRGEFRIFRQGRRDENGRLIYGIADEESRLNLNTASNEELGKLYEITPEVVASIKDWKDGDSTASNGGAEAEYYAALQPPYLPRNGPFQTVRELLMVRGVTPQLFKEEDENQNGLLDPEEDDGTDNLPPDNRDGMLDGGWSSLLTVSSSVANLNAAGQARVNVQNASERDLTAVPGITAEIAKGIIATRGQNQLENLADLLDVTANPQGSGNNPPGEGRIAGQPTSSRAQASGPKLIDEQKLMDIADDITVKSETEEAGLVNINTAPQEVLRCLPGITKELAEAIVSYRQSAGFFPNIAWLLKVDGMSKDILKQVSPKVCARSENFRIFSEGRVRSTGARKRIEMIVRQTASGFQTLSYREDI